MMTVKGPMDPADMGNTLIHEHILVDFVGARDFNPRKWNREDVVKKVLPYLKEAKKAGCSTFIDCTPNYLGRDAVLLQWISELSELNIITNTGYYGGSDHKFLPEHFFSESPAKLAARWVEEWKNGIDATSVRPGFIKISVNPGKLSDVSKKLVQAAALTHLQTGLVIASHTGPAVAALEEIEILRSVGVDPAAFIWVHAQNEPDLSHYLEAARQGSWISLDGLNENNLNDYVSRLSHLKSKNYLHKTLISHDAGWYDPSKPEGGTFRGYTLLFEKLLPALERAKFENSEVKQLIQLNPQKAFGIEIKKWKK
jgi:phosphotriesterase-related protein